jgi:hypothetical protein
LIQRIAASRALDRLIFVHACHLRASTASAQKVGSGIL